MLKSSSKQFLHSFNAYTMCDDVNRMYKELKLPNNLKTYTNNKADNTRMPRHKSAL